MYIVTPEEMSGIDQRAIRDFGIPGIVLMENAALKVFKVLKEEYTLSGDERITVVCGIGNNGGDGFAVARHLYLEGFMTEVVVINPGNNKITGDACTNYCILEKLGTTITNIVSKEQTNILADIINKSDYIIDAIFGTGLKRFVDGLFKEGINEINKARAPVISVDIPSGIDGKTGSVMGVAVKASHTITFGYLKRGHLLYPGRSFTGKLHIAPISLPSGSPKALNVKAFTLNDSEASLIIKPRPRDGHKTTFGRVGIVAGSIGYTGAAYLTTQAALRSGAGLVTLGVPASLISVFQSLLREAMTVPLYDGSTGRLSLESADEILNMAINKEVLAVGPGLSVTSGLTEMIKKIILNTDIPIVLDADGLNNISGDTDILSKHNGKIIITPHPGEMSRLTGMTIDQIKKDPVGVASGFSQRFKIVVLLKGAASVVAGPDGRIYINSSGNSGMGTGGSGDVLTGIIASLVAQGYSLFDAAVSGCYIHGKAGDDAAREKGEVSMIAGDIIDYLPEAFNSITRL